MCLLRWFELGCATVALVVVQMLHRARFYAMSNIKYRSSSLRLADSSFNENQEGILWMNDWYTGFQVNYQQNPLELYVVHTQCEHITVISSNYLQHLFVFRFRFWATHFMNAQFFLVNTFIWSVSFVVDGYWKYLSICSEHKSLFHLFRARFDACWLQTLLWNQSKGNKVSSVWRFKHQLHVIDSKFW